MAGAGGGTSPAADAAGLVFGAVRKLGRLGVGLWV